jgi:hypothetical protein
LSCEGFAKLIEELSNFTDRPLTSALLKQKEQIVKRFTQIHTNPGSWQINGRLGNSRHLLYWSDGHGLPCQPMPVDANPIPSFVDDIYRLSDLRDFRPDTWKPSRPGHSFDYHALLYFESINSAPPLASDNLSFPSAS